MTHCNHPNDLGLPCDVAPFDKLRAGRAVSLSNGKLRMFAHSHLSPAKGARLRPSYG